MKRGRTVEASRLDRALSKRAKRRLRNRGEPVDAASIEAESLDKWPSYEDIGQRVADLLLERGEWCGAPVPMEGLQLDIEARNPYTALGRPVVSEHDTSPFASSMRALTATGPQEIVDGEDRYEVVNQWYSEKHLSTVWVLRNKATGHAVASFAPRAPYVQRFDFALHSLGAIDAMSIEAEGTAMGKLAALIGMHRFKQYVLLGAFIETSARSGVTYFFRRARPTIAFRSTEQGGRILAALCFHSIGYYQGTHVGAMVPTDDVIAHLLLMRADEHMYWRRSNQHHPSSPNAGL